MASFAKRTVALVLALSTPAGVTALSQASVPASMLACDLTAYAPRGGNTAGVSGDVLLVQWPGAEDERLRLGLGIVDGRPAIRSRFHSTRRAKLGCAPPLGIQPAMVR